MQNRTGLIFLFLITFLLSCSSDKNEKILIVFEKPPTLKKAQELVLNLSSVTPNKNLSKFLNNQNWINSFLIKKHAFKPLEIFIDSKEPKYIWQENFYLDAKLSKFLYFGEYPDLLHLDMPIEFVEQWLRVEEEINLLTSDFKLKISSISYSEPEGWHFKSNSNLHIKLGSDLSFSALEKLELTLKYIFEKNLTPRIIDLRYRDGAALNYAK